MSTTDKWIQGTLAVAMLGTLINLGTGVVPLSDGAVGLSALFLVLSGLVSVYRFQLHRTWRRTFLWTLATSLSFVAALFLEARG